MANCLHLNYGGIKKLLTMFLTLCRQQHELVVKRRLQLVVLNITK